MTFQQIQNFVAVAKYQNISQAADTLYVSQPTLSRQIATLEKDLGIELFVRKGNSVVLTNAGTYLAEQFNRILADFDRIVETAQSISGGFFSKLRVGILDGLDMSSLFPYGPEKMREEYPLMTLELHSLSSGLISSLYSDNLDIIITLAFDVERRANLKHRELLRARPCLVVPASHPLASKETADILDFRDEIFFLFVPTDSVNTSQPLIAYCEEHGFTPKVRYTSSLNDSLLMVQAGEGVSLFNSKTVGKHNPNIKYLRTEPFSKPNIVAAWHESNANTLVEPFVECLLEAANHRK